MEASRVLFGALGALGLLALPSCVTTGGDGELLPNQTLQPIEVTRFLGAVPPTVFLFHDWNAQGYPEYMFEIDGSLMVGVPGDGQSPPMLIDKFEITNSQYCRFCNETGRIQPKDPTNPAWRHYYYLPKPTSPIDHVAWFDANDYARWSGKELPTAAEWRRAAFLGGEPPWQNGPLGLYVANVGEVRRRAPDPVGSYPADISLGGIHDMAGNIDEWVADAGYGPNRRVMGGFWGSPRDDLLQLVQNGSADDAHEPRHGFRTVFRLEPLPPAVPGGQ